MTVAEAAKRLECSPIMVRDLCRKKLIGHHRIGVNGGRIRITESQLQDYLARTDANPRTQMVIESVEEFEVRRIQPEDESHARTSLGHTGYIYFIRCPLNGYIKIGFSRTSPDARFDALSAGCPVPLEKLAIMHGSQLEESGIHGTFSPYRANREWFRPEPALLAFIGKHARNWRDMLDADTKKGALEGMRILAEAKAREARGEVTP